MVKTTPAAMDSPAEPVVWTMLFSRIVARVKRRKSVMDMTAMGMDAETVIPTLRARYTEEAAKMMPRMAPMMTARAVNSRGCSEAGMKGSKLWCDVGLLIGHGGSSGECAQARAPPARRGAERD